MTSVASYGNASTAGNYTLVHSGTTLGNWVDNYSSRASLMTEVQVRHNFWSTSSLLDGSYPALVWDHEFTVYTESGSIHGFMNKWYTFAGRFLNRARPLRMQAGDTSSVVVDFGDCYLTAVDQENPSSLLQHAAGFVKLRFKGTQVPTVII